MNDVIAQQLVARRGRRCGRPRGSPRAGRSSARGRACRAPRPSSRSSGRRGRRRRRPRRRCRDTRAVWKPWRAKTRMAASRMIRRLSAALTRAIRRATSAGWRGGAAARAARRGCAAARRGRGRRRRGSRRRAPGRGRRPRGRRSCCRPPERMPPGCSPIWFAATTNACCSIARARTRTSQWSRVVASVNALGTASASALGVERLEQRREAQVVTDGQARRSRPSAVLRERPARRRRPRARTRGRRGRRPRRRTGASSCRRRGSRRRGRRGCAVLRSRLAASRIAIEPATRSIPSSRAVRRAQATRGRRSRSSRAARDDLGGAERGPLLRAARRAARRRARRRASGGRPPRGCGRRRRSDVSCTAAARTARTVPSSACSPYRGSGDGPAAADRRAAARMPLVLDGRPRKRWRYVGRVRRAADAVRRRRADRPAAADVLGGVGPRAPGAARAHAAGAAARGSCALPRGRRRRSATATVRARPRRRAGRRRGDGVRSTAPSWIWTRKQGARARARARWCSTARRSRSTRSGCVDESAGYHARAHRLGVVGGRRRALTDGRAVGWNLVTGLHDARDRAASARSGSTARRPRRRRCRSRAARRDRVRRRRASCAFAAEATRRAHATTSALFRSDYVQPFGTFTGTLPGGLELAEGRGVMERHSALW